MLLGFENGRNARYIVVVNKGVKVLAAVKTPVFVSELTVYRVRYLEHIHIVEAGEQALVAFVVGNGIEHLIVHPDVIVAMERFAEQEEVLSKPLAVTAQLFEEVLVKTIRHVKTQTVNAELVFPARDNVL